jgi:flagella basal body P-ring formation protein FlgA
MKEVKRIRWIVCAAVFFVFSLGDCNSAWAKTTLKVLEHPRVHAQRITLGAIAVIEGDDQQLIERLKAVELGKAPYPGKIREMSAYYIKMKIRHSDIDCEALAIDLPEKIEVVRGATTITPQKIEEIVKGFILTKMRWDPEAVSMKIAPVKGITLAEGKVTHEVTPRKREDYLGTTNLSVAFLVDGRLEKKAWVTAEIEVSEEVVVSNRPLKRYDVIAQEDVRLEKMNLADLSPHVITDPREVIGKRTKRVVEPGTPLKLTFLEMPPLVKRGDLVTIVAESEVLKITTQGVVTESGCKGDMVRVINTSSRKELYATVRDSRTVAIDF